MQRYDGYMAQTAPKRSVTRIILIALLVAALVILGVVAAVLIPILTHSSSGGSGQEIPTEFVAESSANGADGRTRTLKVEQTNGAAAELGELIPGDEILVSGTGFDSGIGIYIGFCAIPDTPEKRPSPCLGGIPEGAEQGDAAAQEALASAWVTSDWAWKSFATQSYDNAGEGSFEVRLTVPEPTVEGLDCRVQRCAIVTRADHTALRDRVQDMMLPFAFATE